MDYAQELAQRIAERKATIAVVGLGYVGLPLALGFARQGFRVLGVDDDLRKVEALLAGKDYINGQDELVKSMVASGKLTPERDSAVLGHADAIVICVPTPLTRNREPDISYVEGVGDRIGQLIRPGTLVVLESTTYPGTTEEVVKPAVEKGGRVSQVGTDYFLAFSPERVDPGNPDYHTYNTTKVVGGVTPACSKLTQALYQSMLSHPDLVRPASSPRAAEMEKLFENIFRSVNIALVNELALLCRVMGLSVWEILDLADTKPFGFMRFNPGPGIGGHCIPLDPFYLTWKAREFDFPTRFIELAGELNNRMPYHVVELVSEALGTKGISQAQVLLLGIAYKKDVADHRESPALRIIEILQKRGANVSYHDPLIDSIRLHDGQVMKSVDFSAVKKADCVVLATDHSAFEIRDVLRQTSVLVDTRGVTQGVVPPEGCRVVTLGSPSKIVANSPQHETAGAV